jgi:hypothetical protein
LITALSLFTEKSFQFFSFYSSLSSSYLFIFVANINYWNRI